MNMGGSRIIIWLVALCILLPSKTAIAASAEQSSQIVDNLNKPDAQVGPYADFVKHHFLVTPFDCGRFYSFGGRVASVYYDSKSNDYKVTSIAASKDLSAVSLREEKNLSFSRVDAGIRKDTALAVRAAWHAMLTRPYAPRIDPRTSSSAVVDGVYDEFSLTVRDNGKIAGMTPPNPKAWGPHVRQMWDIGLLLIDYCKSNTNERQRLAENIKRKATMLAASLEKTSG